MDRVLFKNAKECATALINKDYPITLPWKKEFGMLDENFPKENTEKAIEYVEKNLLKNGYTSMIKYTCKYDDFGMGSGYHYITFENVTKVPMEHQRISINGHLYHLDLIDDIKYLPKNAELVTVFEM